MSIKHDESYYITGMKSMGINSADLTHDQIAIWKSQCKLNEADILISLAFRKDNISKLKQSDIAAITNVK